MAAFHEVRFPEKVSNGAVGGPAFRTTVFTRHSGYEDRNIEWSSVRHEYDVAQAIKTQTELDEIRDFFFARRGRAYGFRFKDWSDYKSCAVTSTRASSDQFLGNGDGATAAFQLRKLYYDSISSYYRTITKPMAGATLVEVDGVAQTETTDFTVDTATGVITFEPGSIPGSGLAVKAGFRFDVPVRFDTDQMLSELQDYNVHTWGQIPLIEVRI